MIVAPAEETLFEAVVVPYRSLSRRGLHILIAAICAASLLTTTVFFLLGAWPVAGFSGAEITLATLLLRLNARAVRRSELILLTPGSVCITRTDLRGQRTETRLDTAWLTVVLEERPARVPGLFLTTRSRREEVARELGEAEKRDLHAAFARALHCWRNPVFDNLQLRAPELGQAVT